MRQITQDPHTEKVVRPIDMNTKPIVPQKMKKEAGIILIVYTVLLLLGVGTGYLLAQKGGASIGGDKGTPITGDKVVGVKDASTFKDCATGTLEKGGVDGEGTHKLVRDGGPSQTAYLVSSIVDLDQYVSLKVEVCGQTLAAKKVSWLMDVGRLEVQ